MEVRKSDSKGRVSGFLPGTQFAVGRREDGAVLLTPLSALLAGEGGEGCEGHERE